MAATMAITVSELAQVAENLEDVEREYRAIIDACRARRNAAILQAISEGMTHRAIAEATGLTYGRVGQIASQANLGKVTGNAS